MSDLLLPSTMKPWNLNLPPGMHTAHVEGDVFNICERVAEVDKNLRVTMLDGPDVQGNVYVISELCHDGVERLVFRVPELDNRVIGQLEMIMRVPLNVRLDLLEKREYKLKQETMEKELDDLYDKMGAPMWHQLEHDGFIQRPVSYPKKGIKPTREP